MQCIEGRDLELEESKKNITGGLPGVGRRHWWLAQGRGRYVLTIILLFLYKTREGEAQRMRKGALKMG